MSQNFAPIISDRSAWRGSDLAGDRSWIYTFSRAELDELDAALQRVLAKGIPLLEITRDDFPLPLLAPVLARQLAELHSGRGFFVLRGKPTPFMNAPIAVKRSYAATNRTAVKKFVKAFADATRYLVDNREGTMRPLTQLLNSNDSENLDFAYQYLQVNSEPTLYPPEDAVKNLIRMSAYMDKKLGAISASRVMDFSILDEFGTKRNQRAQK